MWFIDWLDCNTRALGIWLGIDTYTAARTFVKRLLVVLVTVVMLSLLCYYALGVSKNEKNHSSDRRNRNNDAAAWLLQFSQGPGASLADILRSNSSLN